MLILKNLRDVLAGLRESNTPTIVLKGAALAEDVYPSPGLRPMSDVDLLVRKDDLPRADKRLKSLGYFPVDGEVNEINTSITGYLNSLEYRREDQVFPSLHVHWHLINSSVPTYMFSDHVDMQKIFRAAVETKIAGVSTHVLAPHHFLIHLCEHALRIRHSLDRLILLADIAAVIRRYDKLDWDLLVKDSFDWRLDRLVYFSLYFSSILLEAEIPDRVLRQLAPGKLTCGERIFTRLVSRNRRCPGLSYLLYLAMNKGPLRKTRFIWRTAFPPRGILRQRRYEKQFNPVHYLSRMREVFGAGLNALLAGMRR